MFFNKAILVTGGTGSFGTAFVDFLIGLPDKSLPSKIAIFSRDEMKQWEMRSRLSKHKNFALLDFIIGDVRDFTALQPAVDGIDYVVHAAATKIVPVAEHSPIECIKTNIDGAINVIRATKSSSVEKVVALSTDKACDPVNLYGATKLASDKLFVAANVMKGRSRQEKWTRYMVTRYGNVINSRGSVIPFYQSLLNRGINSLPVTDVRMTRFVTTMESAIASVISALELGVGGEIFVNKCPSMKLTDIAKGVGGDDVGLEIIGRRPGEKLHEIMISQSDSYRTLDFGSYFIILPDIEGLDPARFKYTDEADRLSDHFEYVSSDNSDWWGAVDLKLFLNAQNETLAV